MKRGRGAGSVGSDTGALETLPRQLEGLEASRPRGLVNTTVRHKRSAVVARFVGNEHRGRVYGQPIVKVFAISVQAVILLSPGLNAIVLGVPRDTVRVTSEGWLLFIGKQPSRAGTRKAPRHSGVSAVVADGENPVVISH